jgi:hypothetical protein
VSNRLAVAQAPMGSSGECAAEMTWRRDVALEMWIDSARDPVSIRLVGIVGLATARSLVNVIRDLLDEGHRNIRLEMTGLGASDGTRGVLLAQLSSLVRQWGGELTVFESSVAPAIRHDSPEFTGSCTRKSFAGVGRVE